MRGHYGRTHKKNRTELLIIFATENYIDFSMFLLVLLYIFVSPLALLPFHRAL